MKGVCAFQIGEVADSQGEDGLDGGGGGSGSVADTSAPRGKGGDGCGIIRHAVLPPGMMLLIR